MITRLGVEFALGQNASYDYDSYSYDEYGSHDYEEQNGHYDYDSSNEGPNATYDYDGYSYDPLTGEFTLATQQPTPQTHTTPTSQTPDTTRVTSATSSPPSIVSEPSLDATHDATLDATGVLNGTSLVVASALKCGVIALLILQTLLTHLNLIANNMNNSTNDTRPY
jgi:hypothetical protein